MATEKRLIPLQKRIIYAGDVFNSLMTEKGWSTTEAADFAKAFRTVDAVEVVRCKDCKHYRNHPNGLCYAWTEPCTNERGYKGEVHCVEPEDFCSYGERRCDNEVD